jgi:hypothetical protein
MNEWGSVPSARLQDLADEDRVIARVVRRVMSTFELNDRVFDERHARVEAKRHSGESIDAVPGKLSGYPFLILTEDAHAKDPSPYDGSVCARLLADAHQNAWRRERGR